MRQRLWGGLAVVALLMTGPQATAQQAERVITNPAWLEIPSPDDMGESYPGFATMLGLSGTAVLKCRVTLEGRLGHCEVLRSAPEGLGFGRAALNQAARFRLSPRTVDGEAEKSFVQFTVNFKLDEDRPGRPWDGPKTDPAQVAAIRAVFARIVEEHGPPPKIAASDLGVDEDRRAEVMAMIETVEGGLLDQRLDAMALQVARALSQGQIAAFLAGGPLPPPPEGVEEQGTEMATLDRLAEQRLRDLYCARYRCGLND